MKSSGKVFEGRKLNGKDAIMGAHAGRGINQGTIGIAMAGNYDNLYSHINNPFKFTGAVPPPECIKTLQELIVKLKQDYPHLTSVVSHSKYKLKHLPECYTSCFAHDYHLIPSLNERYFSPNE